ncbi:uncharacterized protein EDB91DRAFT_1081215 [Suillus paluster]|uniref:uncharacterized protein n=1 Tax=Suillus paluster TaxID=48578 RepID=UPI001B886986|nr:uncharacterized protein EDB91DRAFT_1081215 [Suillus paluster]KAG1743280.1 hypothetical protein EDB91DRAFT_1081215 [Suillus paluster]
MSLGNSKAHGMDTTMRMCNESCKQTQCEVGDQAIGWIEDKEKQKLLIIAILWRSQGILSCRTICYCVQDKDGVEYALKDCWMDEAKKDHEEKVLEMVWGIPNVVTLIAPWDVKYEGEPDSTLHIHNHHRKFSPGFCSHKAMIRKKVLHRDLSPNNLIIHEGHGFFIDFDHAQIITQGSTSIHSPGTWLISLLEGHHTAIARAKGWGNVMVEHTASDDLKSLFYIFIEFDTSFDGPKGSRTDPRKADWWGEVLEGMGATTTPYKSGLVLVLRHDKELMNRMMTYFGGVRDLVQAWHYKFLDVDANQMHGGVTHEEIEGLLNTWVSHAAVDEPHPPEEVLQASLLTSESNFGCMSRNMVLMARLQYSCFVKPDSGEAATVLCSPSSLICARLDSEQHMGHARGRGAHTPTPRKMIQHESQIQEALAGVQGGTYKSYRAAAEAHQAPLSKDSAPNINASNINATSSSHSVSSPAPHFGFNSLLIIPSLTATCST